MISGKRVASAEDARGLRSNQLPPTPIPRGCLNFVRNNDCLLLCDYYAWRHREYRTPSMSPEWNCR